MMILVLLILILIQLVLGYRGNLIQIIRTRKYYCNSDNNRITIIEGDVVEYVNDSFRELGAIFKVTRNKVILHPLCVRPSDTINNDDGYIIISSSSSLSYNDLELYYDDSANSIDVNINDNSIINVIQDGLALTQRVIEDRISNPHSEHSEDCWLLDLKKACVFADNDKYQLKLNIRLPEH